MAAAEGGEDDGLERSVDGLLHGRCPEDGRGLLQEVVIDVNQSLAHRSRLATDIRRPPGTSSLSPGASGGRPRSLTDLDNRFPSGQSSGQADSGGARDAQDG